MSAKRERARIQAEVRRVRKLEAQQLDPVEETRGPCDKHPHWLPDRRLPGQPNTPASLCPHCMSERSAQRRRTGSRLPDDVIASRFNPVLPRGMSRERALGSQAEWESRFARDGKVVPGSKEEEAALARIDELREEEKEREERKRNRVLWPPLHGSVSSGPPVTRIVYPSEANEAQGHPPLTASERADCSPAAVRRSHEVRDAMLQVH
jgi:hypothetical protein